MECMDLDKYKDLTNEEFDEILAEIVSENTENLLEIPGAYEVLAEYYNNDVLDRWMGRQEEEEEED